MGIPNTPTASATSVAIPQYEQPSLPQIPAIELVLQTCTEAQRIRAMLDCAEQLGVLPPVLELAALLEVGPIGGARLALDTVPNFDITRPKYPSDALREISTFHRAQDLKTSTAQVQDGIDPEKYQRAESLLEAMRLALGITSQPTLESFSSEKVLISLSAAMLDRLYWNHTRGVTSDDGLTRHLPVECTFPKNVWLVGVPYSPPVDTEDSLEDAAARRELRFATVLDPSWLIRLVPSELVYHPKGEPWYSCALDEVRIKGKMEYHGHMIQSEFRCSDARKSSIAFCDWLARITLDSTTWHPKQIRRQTWPDAFKQVILENRSIVAAGRMNHRFIFNEYQKKLSGAARLGDISNVAAISLKVADEQAEEIS